MPKFSIIVPYRNRETHLRVFIPHIRKLCEKMNYDAELIIVNQNNDGPFLRGQLLNIGAQHADGTILILHDIDYLARPGTSYWNGTTEVFLPVKKAEFILADGSPRPDADIPSGYRHFKDGVDENFFGAVTSITKEAFFKINGFPATMKGWGVEDAVLRNRCEHFGLRVGRGLGEFEVLPHPDSFPGAQNLYFQENQNHGTEWKSELELGLKTAFPVLHINDKLRDKWLVDKWIDVAEIFVATPGFRNYMTLDAVESEYQDTEEKNSDIWVKFKTLVNSTPYLKEHRDYLVHNQLAYGNTSLHWMWHLLLRDAPQKFKFLEIGVYKGGIINLISLLNKLYKKNGSVYGLTPLTNVDDEFSKHDPYSNYEQCIQMLYARFGLDASDLELIVGLSQDESARQLANDSGPYDLLYIDGCHSNPVVRQDFSFYKELVSVGGYLIADDASNFKKIPDGVIRMDWRGLLPVSEAVRDIIETDDRFKEVMVVGHNRVFRRIK